MRLSEILTEDGIIPEVKGRDKEGVINELADGETSLDKRALVTGILKRERLGSTGIGHSIAIPHKNFRV